MTSRVVPCASCKQPIIWLKTPAGKNIPVNAASVLPDDTAFVWARHETHFATCPDRDKWRKPR